MSHGTESSPMACCGLVAPQTPNREATGSRRNRSRGYLSAAGCGVLPFGPPPVGATGWGTRQNVSERSSRAMLLALGSGSLIQMPALHFPFPVSSVCIYKGRAAVRMGLATHKIQYQEPVSASSCFCGGVVPACWRASSATKEMQELC